MPLSVWGPASSGGGLGGGLLLLGAVAGWSGREARGSGSSRRKMQAGEEEDAGRMVRDGWSSSKTLLRLLDGFEADGENVTEYALPKGAALVVCKT